MISPNSRPGERRLRQLVSLFLLASFAPFLPAEDADVDMYFYSPASDLGPEGGLTDAVLPDRVVWLTLEVNAHSAINSGTATVTLPAGWTYVGVRNDIEIWEEVEVSGQNVTLVIPDQSDQGVRYGGFDARIYVQTPHLDDLPPVAPTFAIPLQLDLDTDDGHVGGTSTFESAMLYARARITSNKAGQTVKAGDRIRFTVEVEPYPHFEVYYSRAGAYAPYGTDFVEGSITGLSGGAVSNLGYILGEYPDGGVRSFNFSYEVEVWEDLLLDLANISEFKADAFAQFRVRTPYTGNKNGPGREFHRRLFDASLEPVPPVEREPPPAAGFVVNSTADRPRDPTRDDCGTGETLENGDPECTLRSIIEGVLAGIVDEVEFDIPGDGVPNIVLTSALPVIDQPIVIDGTTQAAGMVEVQGGGLNAIGIDLQGGASEVRGLILSGFAGAESAGIRLLGGEGSLIAGNWIGLSKDGNTAAQMDRAVLIEDSASNTIGGPDEATDRNLLYGATLGVEIIGDASDVNQIEGNRIGLGLNGKAFELAEGGALIRAGDNNRIGGAGALGNWIVGESAIVLGANAPFAGPIIEGNRIGLEADGKTATNGGFGIVLAAPPEQGLSNVRIQDNRIAGVMAGIFSAGGEDLTGVVIDGNTLGLDFNGAGALPDGLEAGSHDYGIRLESVSQHTVSDNRVAGFAYNVLLTGAFQFYSEPGEDTDGDGEPDEEGVIEFYDPDSPRDIEDDESIGSGNVIEGNTIGLNAGTAVPAGKEQAIGLSLYSKPKDLIVRNNTIAGHAEMDVLVSDGANLRIGGNRIGTTTGTDYGGQIGVAIRGGSDIVIGGSGAGEGNVISRETDAGILVTGAAANILVKGNKIGTDVGATSAWPNTVGIKLEADGDGDEPTGVVIDSNVISGNKEAGIASDIETEVQLKSNYIGVSSTGLPLPNKYGAAFLDTPVVSTDDTFAHNSVLGIEISGATGATVASPSIYLNGGGARLEGILYENPPVAEPRKVFALRYKPDKDNMTRVVVAVAPAPSEGAVVEIFGNRSENEFQGRTALGRETVALSEPFVRDWIVSADSSIAKMDNFTATFTIDGKTSQFSAPADLKEIVLPDLRISDPSDGKILLVWTLLEYFRIVSAPTPSGPWTPIELDPERINGGLYAQEVEVTEDVQFFKLTLDITAAFELD